MRKMKSGLERNSDRSLYMLCIVAFTIRVSMWQNILFDGIN